MELNTHHHCISVPPDYKLDDKYKETIYVKAEENTSVSVPFTGFPVPKAIWKFNDGDLPDARRMTVESINNIAKIHFKNTKRSDTGDYTLILKNPAGETEVTIKLVVLGNASFYFYLSIVSLITNLCELYLFFQNALLSRNIWTVC